MSQIDKEALQRAAEHAAALGLTRLTREDLASIARALTRDAATPAPTPHDLRPDEEPAFAFRVPARRAGDA